MKIRKALEQDVNTMLDLIRELAEFEKESDAVKITEADLLRDGFSSNPLFYALIAELEDEIIGMALYYFRYSTWQGKTIHLEDLIVRENKRGIGVGKALYSAVLKAAKEENVNRMEWVVLDWNTPAISFYEKSGAKILKNWHLVQMDKKGIENYISQL